MGEEEGDPFPVVTVMAVYIYHSLGHPFPPPVFFFSVDLILANPHSWQLHPVPPFSILRHYCHSRYICISVPAYHLVLPVPLSLYLGLSCINPFFFPSFLLPPHRDFQLALACCSPFTRCVFLFLTLTILYFSASVYQCLFSVHTCLK